MADAFSATDDAAPLVAGNGLLSPIFGSCGFTAGFSLAVVVAAPAAIVDGCTCGFWEESRFGIRPVNGNGAFCLEIGCSACEGWAVVDG